MTDFPVNGTPRQKLGFAVKQVMLTLPERPWQPCELRMSDPFVELIANNGPQVEALDPEGREPMISCGASLQYLKIALKHYGCLGRVELFPDLDEPVLAARIHIGCSGERDAQEARLFEAMKLRQTNSFWPDPPPVTEETLDVLSYAFAGERGWLEYAQSEVSRQRLQKLAGAGGRLQVDEVRYRSETLTATNGWEPGGFVRSLLNERFARWSRPFLAVKVRVLPAISHDSDEEGESAALAGTFAVVKTKTDDKHGWVAAGQTMARLILHTRSLGLSCAFFNDVLRRPSMRAELRTGIGHKGFVQAIVRFGTIQRQTYAQSPVMHESAAMADSV